MEPSMKDSMSPEELHEYADLIESMRKSEEYLEYAIWVESQLIEFMKLADEKMEFERLNSFNRFLVHRVCDLYRLERFVVKLTNEPRLATIIVSKKPDSETPRFPIKAVYDRYIEHEKERNGVRKAVKMPKKMSIKRRDPKKDAGLPSLAKSKSESVPEDVVKKTTEPALERSSSAKTQAKPTIVKARQTAPKNDDQREEEIDNVTRQLENAAVTHEDGEEDNIDADEHHRHVERVRDYELSKEKIFNEEFQNAPITDSKGRKIQVLTGEDKSTSRNQLSEDPDFRRTKSKGGHYAGQGMPSYGQGYYPMYNNNAMAEGFNYANNYGMYDHEGVGEDASHSMNTGGAGVGVGGGNGDALLDSEGGIPLTAMRGNYPALSGGAAGMTAMYPNTGNGAGASMSHEEMAAAGNSCVSYAQYAMNPAVGGNVRGGHGEAMGGYGGGVGYAGQGQQQQDNQVARLYARPRGTVRGANRGTNRGQRGANRYY